MFCTVYIKYLLVSLAPSLHWRCCLGGQWEYSEHPVRKNLSDEVLVWLSVWNKMQMTCILSSCSTTSLPPHHLCFRKSQKGLSFWYRPTRVVLGQGWMLLLVSLVTWHWVLLQMFVGCLWELIAPGSVLCIVLRICKCDVECRKICRDVTDSESDRIWHFSLQIRNPIDLPTYADLDSTFIVESPHSSLTAVRS